MPKARVNDIQIYYEVHGNGQPLTLLCGFGGDTSHWRYMLPGLAAHFKVILLDIRGTGQSDKPEMDCTMYIYANDVFELLNTLGIEKTNLLGVSFGGGLSMRFALEYPEKVMRLILVSTGAEPDPYINRIIENWMLVQEKIGRWEQLRLASLHIFAPDMFKCNPERIREIEEASMKIPASLEARKRQAKAAATGAVTLDMISAIFHPTCIICGREDILSRPALSEHIQQKIDGSRLFLIDGAGHGLIWEKPEEINQVIIDFLENVKTSH